jgi:hypothetical protein
MREMQALIIVFCLASITVNQFFILHYLRNIAEREENNE